MGNDYSARKQRRKDSKRNRDDGTPKRIRKKKQPRRICRGECYKSPLLDLDSSDEDMIASMKAKSSSPPPKPVESDQAVKKVKRVEKRGTGREPTASDVSGKKPEKKKMSTSSKLIMPKNFQSNGDRALNRNRSCDQYHPIIERFMTGEKIASPLLLQQICWPIVLKGKNVYVTAQPGSGKTLSYLLPIACKLFDAGHSMATRPTAPLAMVLLPTRELAQQVASVCKLIKRNCNILRVTCLTGGSEKGKQFDSLKRYPHILVATPGRLVDMLEDKAVDLGDINSIILDEADKMLSLGFSDQLEKIRKTLVNAGVNLPSGTPFENYLSDEDKGTDTLPCQVGLYSATNPPCVANISKMWCGDPEMIDLASMKPDQSATDTNKNFESEDTAQAQISKNIVQAVHVCAEHKKMSKLTKHLSNIESLHENQRHKPKILVFANRIKTVKYIARELRGQNKKVAEIHGDKSQEERETAIRDFKGGKFNILIASDVASRGLHVKNLSYVVNYDFPSNLETYIHRVGRTGRVDAEGHAFSFFTRTLAPLASPLIDLLSSHEQDIDPNLLKLAESYKIVEEKLKDAGEKPARIKVMSNSQKKSVIQFDEESKDPFIPSMTFDGPKSGYAFTKGSKGLGYYLDAPRFNRKRPKQVPRADADVNTGGNTKHRQSKRMLPGKLARIQRRKGIPDFASDSD